MSQRLFIGLDLPEECRETLSAIAAPIGGVRWIQKAQLHLTLAFLGDVRAEVRERLDEVMAAIRVPPFTLRIEGAGTFGRRSPTALWAGVGTGHPHLFALHKRVHDALFAAGLNPELRAFHPHITLARLEETSFESMRPFIRKHASIHFCTVQMEHFCLFSSKPHPDGSRYAIEARWKLRHK